MKIPPIEKLDQYYPGLARMVAETSWLPNPETVKALGREAFPTARARRQHPRLTKIVKGKKAIGMYDDNTTARWAILWAHGIVGGKRQGWGFAHVWSVSDNIQSYTNIANLVIVPECFASLTDKAGPLTAYLRWHAWTVYHWKPASAKKLRKPKDYEKISWRYLDKYDDPAGFIRGEVQRRKNQRVQILRPIMKRLGMI